MPSMSWYRRTLQNKCHASELRGTLGDSWTLVLTVKEALRPLVALQTRRAAYGRKRCTATASAAKRAFTCSSDCRQPNEITNSCGLIYTKPVYRIAR